MFSIIVALPKIEDANSIRRMLVNSGFDVDSVCTLGAQAVGRANELDGGVVVSGYRLSDMMFHEIAGYLPKGFELLLLVSPTRLGECAGAGVEYLTMPIRRAELADAVREMNRRYVRLRKQQKRPRERSVEEKELIEQAKHQLMEQMQMSESEAHRYLQKTSMDQGLSFVATATRILQSK